MTDKEPQGEGLLEKYDLTQRELEECYKKWPQQDNLSMFQIVGRKVVGKLLADGYRKLSAPGTEAYQELREKIAIQVSILICGIPDELETEWNAGGLNMKQNCREVADSVLALLRGEEK